MRRLFVGISWFEQGVLGSRRVRDRDGILGLVLKYEVSVNQFLKWMIGKRTSCRHLVLAVEWLEVIFRGSDLYGQDRSGGL